MSSKINMDLSKFRHVHSDDHGTTLRHADGHQLVLNHASLDKNQQAQLKALAASAQTPQDKQEATAEAKTPMAQGGRVTGIRSETAANGVKGANNVRERQDVPHGMTINIQKPEPKTYGKIMDPKGNKPQVYKDGGQIKMYADGTQDADGVQPDDSAPSVPAALSPNAPDLGTNLPNVADPVTVNTGVQTPADRDAYLKAHAKDELPPADLMNNRDFVTHSVMGDAVKQDQDITKQVANEQAATQAAAETRKNEETQQQLSALENAQQKQKMGIPLTPADQAAIDQASQPSAMQSMADATPTGQMPNAGMQTPPEKPGKGDPMLNTVRQMEQGYKSNVAGKNAEASAIGGRGIDEAQAIQHNVDAQEQAMGAYKQHYDALENERQNFIHDVQQGYINPDKYWTGQTLPNGEKVGGHSKIAAGIGMILAGFNPTSQPNAAMNYLKYQMDQNIQAQARNLGASESLLGHNLKQFGNLKDATDMTHVMQNEILAHQLGQAASMSAGPIAKAQAQQANGLLQMDTAQKLRSVSMSQALMKLMSGPGGQSDSAIQQGIGMAHAMGMTDLAKNLQERWIPGVGTAGVPVPQADREKIRGYQDVNRSMNEALAFGQKYGGTFEGTADPRIKHQGQVIIANLGNQIRTAESMGVIKKSEVEMMESLLGKNPANPFAALNSAPQIKEMQHLKQAEYNNMLNSYGVRNAQGSAPQMTQQQAPQYKTVNGVKYMRGPNGQAIKVP